MMKILLGAGVLAVMNILPLQISLDAVSPYIEGTASWYSESDPGIRPTTANMEIFDETKNTCAIWGVPFGTMLEVTNLDNGKTVVVRVNDRGPAKRLCAKGRVIDLTRSAFGRIADTDKGLTRVRIKPHR